MNNNLIRFIPDPDFFDIREFVSKKMFLKYGKKCWMFLNPLILYSAQTLRYDLGPVTINNWHIGGRRQSSGFREWDCLIGEEYSQHKLGNALDTLVKGMTGEEVRMYIIKNQDKYPYITRLEDDVIHTHMDCSNDIFYPLGIHLFKP